MKAMGRNSVSSFLAGLLNVVWYTGAIALVLSTCVVVVALFVDLPGWTVSIPVSFTLDARDYRVTAPSLGIEEAEIIGATSGLNIEDTTPSSSSGKAHALHVQGAVRFPMRRSVVVPNAILMIGGLALGLWMLGNLRAVFRTLRAGRPFVSANATRLRWIGIAIIAGEFGRSAMMLLNNYYAMTYFSAEGLRFDARPDLNLFTIIHGLIVLVIAEVFRTGTRLDEEQSLTV
jgi:hypothetical protein